MARVRWLILKCSRGFFHQRIVIITGCLLAVYFRHLPRAKEGGGKGGHHEFHNRRMEARARRSLTT